jgi:hypothetical protein
MRTVLILLPLMFLTVACSSKPDHTLTIGTPLQRSIAALTAAHTHKTDLDMMRPGNGQELKCFELDDGRLVSLVAGKGGVVIEINVCVDADKVKAQDVGEGSHRKALISVKEQPRLHLEPFGQQPDVRPAQTSLAVKDLACQASVAKQPAQVNRLHVVLLHQELQCLKRFHLANLGPIMPDFVILNELRQGFKVVALAAIECILAPNGQFSQEGHGLIVMTFALDGDEGKLTNEVEVPVLNRMSGFGQHNCSFHLFLL